MLHTTSETSRAILAAQPASVLSSPPARSLPHTAGPPTAYAYTPPSSSLRAAFARFWRRCEVQCIDAGENGCKITTCESQHLQHKASAAAATGINYTILDSQRHKLPRCPQAAMPPEHSRRYRSHWHTSSSRLQHMSHDRVKDIIWTGMRRPEAKITCWRQLACESGFRACSAAAHNVDHCSCIINTSSIRISDGANQRSSTGVESSRATSCQMHPSDTIVDGSRGSADHHVKA